MRLIDADALKKEFTEGAFTTRGVREIIDDAPTVEERPKGRWIKNPDCFVCSVCNEGYKCQPTLMGNPLFEFCPVCGADMRGGQDNDNR